MTPRTFLKPENVRVNRTKFRQHQKAILRRAKGPTVVVLTAREEEDEKCLVDKRYFEEILQQLRATMETLEIAADTKLFSRLLRASETIDEDIRLGRLHSLEEAFR